MSAYIIDTESMDRILSPIMESLETLRDPAYDRSYLRYELGEFGIDESAFDRLMGSDKKAITGEMERKHLEDMLSYIGQKIYRANEYAVNCRYGDNHDFEVPDYYFQMGKFPQNPNSPNQRISDLLEVIKDIDSLLYQMSEGDTLERFDNIVRFLKNLKIKCLTIIVNHSANKYITGMGSLI